MKDPSGYESYMYKGQRIEVSELFVYEVCLYKYWKGGACLLGSRFFTSNKLLSIKRQEESRHIDNYMVVKEVSLVAAPYEFIRENNLPVYELNVKIKKSKKK